MGSLSRIAGWVALALAACSAEPDADVVVVCEPLTDPVLLTQGMPGTAPVGASLGVLDDQVLLHWVDSSARTRADVDRVQWFSAELEPISEVRDLGTRLGLMRSQWTAADGALHAHVWTDPSLASPPAEVDTLLLVFRVGAPDRDGTFGVSHERPSLPVRASADGFAAVAVGTVAALNAGIDGRVPARTWAGRATFAIAAIPSPCAHSADRLRLLVFHESGGDFVASTDRDCVLGQLTHNAEIVPLDDGTLGVLFREGPAVDSALRYTRFDRDLIPVSAPTVVARQERGYFARDDGYQPEAVGVEGSRILFRERAGQGASGPSNQCQWLNAMGQDGSWSRSAPWQMPACREPLAHFTHSSELVPSSGGRAAFAFAQRTSFGVLSELTHITTATEWDEGVFLVALTSEGRRGSEMVRVTGSEATALTQPRTAE